MRKWLNKCGDRELSWLILALTALFLFGLSVLTNALAYAASAGPNDWELATVVAGHDTAPEVERKLGLSPCLVPNSTGDTISYLYNVPGTKGPS